MELGELETFLAKFENIVSYLQWGSEDRYHHLCACLEGAAGQVLWDVGPTATVESRPILGLLRTGSETNCRRKDSKQSCVLAGVSRGKAFNSSI